MNDPTIPSFLLDEQVRSFRSALLDAAGVDPVADRSRTRPAAVARMMLTYRLLMLGWTEMQIGNAVGIDHSTVNHHKRRMEEILSGTPGYDTERDMWRKFMTLL